MTGASYGVGAATARALALAGYDLISTATNIGHLTETVKSLQGAGVRAVATELDLCQPDSIDRAMFEINRLFGVPSLLINNAATNLFKPATDIAHSEWTAVLATNVTGTFFLTQVIARQWIFENKPGAIVNVAPTHGLIAADNRCAYTPSSTGTPARGASAHRLF